MVRADKACLSAPCAAHPGTAGYPPPKMPSVINPYPAQTISKKPHFCRDALLHLLHNQCLLEPLRAGQLLRPDATEF
jgi:hypothetical protein